MFAYKIWSSTPTSLAGEGKLVIVTHMNGHYELFTNRSLLLLWLESVFIPELKGTCNTKYISRELAGIKNIYSFQKHKVSAKLSI